MPSYIAPYRGVSTALPPGYMEAATAPGRYIAQGIASAGEAIGSFIDHHRQEAKQGKAAEVFYEAIPEAERPMDLQAFKNLAAKDKVSTMRGLVEGQAYRRGAEDLISKLANRNYIQTQQKLMESQLGEIGRRRGKEAEREARLDLLNEDLRSRFSLPEGEQGPLPALDTQTALQMLAKHGLLMDDQTDNLVQSLGRAGQRSQNPLALGVPGTITPVEGDPDMRFAWMTDKSGQFIHNPKEPAPAPDGFVTWQDPNGKTKIMRKPSEPRLSSVNEQKVQSLARNRERLARLQDLKAMGAKRFVYQGSEPVKASSLNWFTANDLTDELAATEQLVRNLELELGASKINTSEPAGAQPKQPAGGMWEGYQRWKGQAK